MENKIHNCIYCSLKIEYSDINRKEITTHYFNEHRISLKKDYKKVANFIKSYFYKNEIPLCTCGCGEQVDYFIPGKNCWATLKHGHYVRILGNNPTRDNPEIAAGIGAKVVATKNKRKAGGKVYTSWCKGLAGKNDPRLVNKYKGKTLEEKCGEEKAKKIKKKLSEKAIKVQSDPKRKEAASKHFSEYWGKEENQQRQSANKTKWIEENNYYTSKLEEGLKTILQNKEILEKHQFRISTDYGSKVYDFKLKGKKFVVEIDGDYWHCNPKKFPNGPVTAKQSSNISNDNFKNFVACAEGFQVYRIWEDDFKNDLDNTIDKLIVAYNNYEEENLQLLPLNIYTDMCEMDEQNIRRQKSIINIKETISFIKKRSEISLSDLKFKRGKFIFYLECSDIKIFRQFIVELMDFDKRIDYEFININKCKCLIVNSEI